jgi:negative regulator of flagellin synthesis FlgM
MKISSTECGRATVGAGRAQEKILPSVRPKGLGGTHTSDKKKLSPLERGMAVAEEALAGVPEIREDIVADVKDRIALGEYNVSGDEIADMMLRRLAADRIR